jgi:hypothetical protein
MTTDERLADLRERIISMTSELRQRRLAADFDDTPRAEAKVDLIERAETNLEDAAQLLARALTVTA